MPDCPNCGAGMCMTERRNPQWWGCPASDCDIVAILDDDAPPTEDPRNPQTTLTDKSGSRQ